MTCCPAARAATCFTAMQAMTRQLFRFVLGRDRKPCDRHRIGWRSEGDTYNGIENLVGSAFDDQLTGDASANVLRGGSGNDDLRRGRR